MVATVGQSNDRTSAIQRKAGGEIRPLTPEQQQQYALAVAERWATKLTPQLDRDQLLAAQEIYSVKKRIGKNFRLWVKKFYPDCGSALNELCRIAELAKLRPEVLDAFEGETWTRPAAAKLWRLINFPEKLAQLLDRGPRSAAETEKAIEEFLGSEPDPDEELNTDLWGFIDRRYKMSSYQQAKLTDLIEKQASLRDPETKWPVQVWQDFLFALLDPEFETLGIELRSVRGRKPSRQPLEAIAQLEALAVSGNSEDREFLQAMTERLEAIAETFKEKTKAPETSEAKRFTLSGHSEASRVESLVR